MKAGTTPIDERIAERLPRPVAAGAPGRRRPAGPPRRPRDLPGRRARRPRRRLEGDDEPAVPQPRLRRLRRGARAPACPARGRAADRRRPLAGPARAPGAGGQEPRDGRLGARRHHARRRRRRCCAGRRATCWSSDWRNAHPVALHLRQQLVQVRGRRAPRAAARPVARRGARRTSGPATWWSSSASDAVRPRSRWRAWSRPAGRPAPRASCSRTPPPSAPREPGDLVARVPDHHGSSPSTATPRAMSLVGVLADGCSSARRTARPDRVAAIDAGTHLLREIDESDRRRWTSTSSPCCGRADRRADLRAAARRDLPRRRHVAVLRAAAGHHRPGRPHHAGLGAAGPWTARRRVCRIVRPARSPRLGRRPRASAGPRRSARARRASTALPHVVQGPARPRPSAATSASPCRPAR